MLVPGHFQRSGMTLGVATISTYRARILDKMKLQTNADLIRYVIENDLLK